MPICSISLVIDTSKNYVKSAVLHTESGIIYNITGYFLFFNDLENLAYQCKHVSELLGYSLFQYIDKISNCIEFNISYFDLSTQELSNKIYVRKEQL